MINTDFPCQVSELTVAYHDRMVLHQVDLSLEPGSVMAILGPNGAGKSTLIKSALGLIPRLGGKVSFFGKPLSQVRKRIGYMPQSAEVDWDFPATVKDVVTMGTYGRLGWFKRPGATERKIVAECLEMLGIADLAERQISELSGGQKQRTFVARTLAGQPDLCVMDEPFAGVDIGSENTIMEVLKNLARQGKTVLVVHHDLGTVRKFCSAVTLLNDGRVVSSGNLREAFTSELISKAYGIDLACAIDPVCPVIGLEL